MQCYRCFSKDRERLVYLYLKEYLKIFEGSKQLNILHIAPEPTLTKTMLKHKFNNYVCGDLFTEGYTYPPHVIDMNVLNIPFENDYFDIIICNHVLEHIPEDIKAMQELKRVLKPKTGKAILLVPISANSAETYEDFSITEPSERKKHFGQYDHCRIYGQDYPDRLKKAGFNVDRINIFNQFPKHGLNQKEDLFVCHK